MAQVYLPERTEAPVRPPRAPLPTPRDSAPNDTQSTAPESRRPGLADAVVIAVLVGVVALIIAAAGRWTAAQNPTLQIDLSPGVLPLYAGFSLLRMTLAYGLSLAFTLVYGHVAATSPVARRFMVPLLDILQSIPILSFLPGVVLALIAVFPHSNIGLELSAIILIFTSQAWNMTFSFYHSANTIPADLREAAAIFRLTPWRRFTKLEVPFGMIGLVWNSMMSWAGGWFFLMAAEQLTLGDKSFQLLGLGSYLQKAANIGDSRALLLGLGTLVIMIILLDLVVWRPLVAWSDKFKFETVRSTEAPESPVLDFLRRSALLDWFSAHVAQPVGDRLNTTIDTFFTRTQAPTALDAGPASVNQVSKVIGWVVSGLLAVVALLGLVQALHLLAQVHIGTWGTIVVDALLTFVRTITAMAISLAWTVPVGVKIGMSPKWSKRLQPVVQVIASIPATAFFPVLLLLFFKLPQGVGINVAAIVLMLLGTQWYMLFNIIAGAMSIPADLREAARVYQISGWRLWRHLILPAIFPFLVTGLITASGGAWNTSVVAEIVTFNQHTIVTRGLGSLIAQSAASNDLATLLASTIVMAAIVVLINRLVWKRLYSLADRRFALLG